MKTRAQRRREVTSDSKQRKSALKKKEILEIKAKAKATQAEGKPGGNKKVKKDLSPPPLKQPANKLKAKVVRVVESKDEKRKSASVKVNKQIEQQRRSSIRKRPSVAADTSSQKDKKVKDQKVTDKDEKQRTSKEQKKTADQPESKENFKKIQFKGKVPIDEFCSHSKNANYEVLQTGGKVYSATLNQTSVQNNNNKFYILQVIKDSRNTNTCYFWTRWGRVGVQGQTSLIGPFNMATAISLYNSKYHDKFHKGNYREVELNYENEEEDKKADEPTKKSEEKKYQKKTFEESKLSKPVRKLIELIFDINMMNKQMVEIGYNVSKMPLGKLSKDNIKHGYSILQKLMDELKGKNQRTIVEDLTNDFYSYIPHDFGFAKMSNFILDDVAKVKKKIEMLESLAEIKVATTLLSSADEDENKLDSNYKKLNRDIVAIDKQSETFELINRYLQSTHAKTHSGYTLELEDLFELNSGSENARFTKDIDNRMLLWHGSRLTNFVGILSQGLRIAPPEAPVTGYMFGKGVYFADMSSKSANYCCTSRDSSTGILLLCEVALGEMNEKLHSDYYAGNLPPGKSSTKGMGRTCPNPSNFVKMSDGVVIPMGPGEQVGRGGYSLQYNQFIVYDVAQIKIRYLLRTKFNYKSFGFGY